MATPSTLRSSKPANAHRHAFRTVAGGTDHDLVAALDGDVFEALHQFGKEWIRDIGDHQAEHAAASRNQRPRLAVGIVSEFLDRLPNSLSRLGIHRRRVVQSSGDGGNGHLGSPGYVTNAHAYFFRPSIFIPHVLGVAK